MLTRNKIKFCEDINQSSKEFRLMKELKGLDFYTDIIVPLKLFYIHRVCDIDIQERDFIFCLKVLCVVIVHDQVAILNVLVVFAMD